MGVSADRTGISEVFPTSGKNSLENRRFTKFHHRFCHTRRTAVIAAGEIYCGVLTLFISQILDCTDGDLARLTGRVTRSGAYLDRVFDRFVDAAIVIGMVYLYPSELWLAGFMAVVGSFGVSITRAMAEAAGADCKVGIGGRDTRLAIIMVGLLYGYASGNAVSVYAATLWIVAVLGFITTLHRMLHTLKQLQE
jgi:CDP-diacylglycerol--glycerol-3-phosphate 3-phosphatidyltransferase